MLKVCSLDFINNDEFGTDILSSTGEVLYSAEEKITPEILLKLYFKEIFTNQEISTSSEGTSETAAVKKPQKIKFDEEQAKRVAKWSLEIGKLLGFEQNELEELELAAYNHKIGSSKFTEDQAENKDFKNMCAEAGYEYLLKIKHYPDKVAEVAKLYLEKYDCNKFDINKIDLKMPFYQIVAITSYYDEYFTKTNSKEETLKKMLRLGQKRFNPYILHKFTNYMRNNNE